MNTPKDTEGQQPSKLARDTAQKCCIHVLENTAGQPTQLGVELLVDGAAKIIQEAIDGRSPSPRLREVVEDAAKSMKALMRMLEATDDPKDEFTIVYERLQEAESALAAIEEEMK